MRTSCRPLNWKEIETYAVQLDSQIQGSSYKVEKIVIPDRTDLLGPKSPENFLKDEWSFRLHGGRETKHLIFGIRPGFPYLCLGEGGGPRASTTASWPPFLSLLGKVLPGQKFLRVMAVPQDRRMWLQFESHFLLVELIPHRPDVLLFEDGNFERVVGSSPVASYRDPNQKDFAKFSMSTSAPKLPQEVQAYDAKNYYRVVHDYLRQELTEKQKLAAIKIFEKELQVLEKNIDKCEETLRRTREDHPFGRWGELLKSALGQKPDYDPKKKAYDILDFETDERVWVPANPSLTLLEQAEFYFKQEKRKKTRLQEVASQLSEFEREKETLLKKLLRLQQGEVSSELLATTRAEKKSTRTASPTAEFGGKTFFSSEGLRIAVGRNLKENHALTFKLARGRDVWLHLRGRPSAHVVIFMNKDKSPSLETLLDAAQVLLFYTGIKGRASAGEKFEVDYTLKKNVQTIKGTSQVRYTQNKTLNVAVDPERMQSVRERSKEIE